MVKKPRHLSSFIDVDTWNIARWLGVMFEVDPDAEAPPAIGIFFADETAGRKIFSDLIGRLGREDEFELLRVSIIEGDIPGEDPGYTVYLGTDPENYGTFCEDQGIDLSQHRLAILGRYKRMNPAPGSPHLATFKTAFERAKTYLLIPVFGTPEHLRPERSLSIKKTKVRYVQADQLTREDLEAVVLPDSLIEKIMGKPPHHQE
jgi:hypothetical protein